MRGDGPEPKRLSPALRSCLWGPGRFFSYPFGPGSGLSFPPKHPESIRQCKDAMSQLPETPGGPPSLPLASLIPKPEQQPESRFSVSITAPQCSRTHLTYSPSPACREPQPKHLSRILQELFPCATGEAFQRATKRGFVTGDHNLD